MDVTGWRWLRQHVELLPIAPIQKSRHFEALVSQTTAANQQQNKSIIDDGVAQMYGLTAQEMAFIRAKTGDF